MYVGRGVPRKAPAVKVPVFQYLMMQLAIFHNAPFMQIVYGQFFQLPRVECFSHWLRLMTLSVQFERDQGRRLYQVVGAMYYVYSKCPR
ncbi:hypothetical protein NCAS_0G04260 [Naumovozyma castellii]|uniref:Uncharacterized protein n=1 Tax=Naumovozyma castellii TaxID=27288 RepID=G0VHK6_NAUCA|nr:hypothetical protein NCAS_0G04260 [Naumovozyma castellii CBS 4309]CCC71313.1 hypothetical protein NCAS_0G04260 [Naumovozyma castellii CBS 4309]